MEADKGFTFPPGTVAVAGDTPGKLKEFSMPATKVRSEHDNVVSLFRRRVTQNPDQTVIEQKTMLGEQWRKVSAGEFWDEVCSVSRGLLGIGLKPGDRLALHGPTSYEWTLIDMAALAIGIITVPIYETDSAAQIEWILKDSDIRYAIASNQSSQELIQAVAARADRKCRIFSLAAGDLLTIIEAGRQIAPAVIDSYNAQITGDTIATIIYTSGTTGRPKGTLITQRNATALLPNLLDYLAEIGMQKTTRCLLFLPVAHALARLVSWGALLGPGVLGLVPDTKNLLGDLASFKPSYILAVPRVLEKIYNAADASAGHGIKLRLFRLAAKSAIDYSKALDTPQGPSRALKIRRQVFYQLVLSRLTNLLGGNAKYIISGGGPLSVRLGHFFRGIGVTVCEGYGLTETLGPATVNVPTRAKIGSVGQPVPGIAVRISDEGEVLFKGDAMSPGYLNLEKETAELYTEDGWLHSEDKGWIDDDGFVYITGRMKEIIVTAGGKNVSPEILEDGLRGHPLISNVVAVGDRRPFIAALVTLDAEMLPGWLRNHNLPPMDISDAARHPAVLKALERAVARTNQKVSRAESIRKIRVLTTDFSLENGTMTPSLKVKRSVVLKRFESEINAIYGGPLQDD